MSEIFLKIINMSISASYIVLAVLLLRLLLRKAPKWITVLLWGMVAIRLICPFSLESILSLIPSAEVVSPDIMMDQTPSVNTGIPMINNTLTPVINESFVPAPGDSVNPLQIWIPVGAALWLMGTAALLGWGTFSYLRLKKQVQDAKLLKEKILAKEFRCTENRLLEINFQNARCVYDTNRNLYVQKKKSRGKVDMVVSMINAVYLLQQDVFLNQMSFTVQVI